MSNIALSGKQGKVWGWTECILKIPSVVEAWSIHVKPGSYCSKHRHNKRHNQFSILSGTLQVEVWKNDYNLIDLTTLTAGQSMIVKPGEYHRFHNKSNSECIGIEFYWVECDNSDIEREDHGGVDEHTD